ncbi:eukaryotic peptide chain release factor GTP-binding subunit ERF3B-like, partial [Stegodyphus dumicola]|uniref:eukaryotic peptide chain release factor GTP-binding subunit ERF3B-like n=1 Tax=Stegodyphus dumicola TaxID=202533 RepID=UPI0015B18DC6
MDQKTDDQGTPDSWEQHSDGALDNGEDSDNLSKPFLGLNVDAPPFVPSFATLAAAQAQNPVSEDEANSETEKQPVPDPPPLAMEIDLKQGGDVDGGSDDSPADWENVDIENNHLADDDEEIVEEVEIVSKSKKKVLQEEEEGVRKEHVNVVFIGHVDAGKSTIGGQLLYLTGMVDKRTLEKYEREAKEKNRESWYLSWALDTNQ